MGSEAPWGFMCSVCVWVWVVAVVVTSPAVTAGVAVYPEVTPPLTSVNPIIQNTPSYRVKKLPSKLHYKYTLLFSISNEKKTRKKIFFCKNRFSIPIRLFSGSVERQG
jgi:hypothetical protein